MIEWDSDRVIHPHSRGREYAWICDRGEQFVWVWFPARQELWTYLSHSSVEMLPQDCQLVASGPAASRQYYSLDA